jgi:hypothetical protein
MKKIVLSWDTIISLVVTAVAWKFIPEDVTNKLALSIYGTAITVLAIIFSIFFASLAVILAFPDNEFIVFIEAPGKLFSRLLVFFRTTLAALFVSLVYTIGVYVSLSFCDPESETLQGLFIAFIFLFTYSLFATAIAVDVTLKLTSRRAGYLVNKYELRNEEGGEETGDNSNAADTAP